MSFFLKGLSYKNNNDLVNAIIFFKLSVLMGDKRGLKELETLDSGNRKEYFMKYLNNESDDLRELSNYWYSLRIRQNVYSSLNEEHVIEIWKKLWFAKGNDQVKVDQELKERFSEIFEKYKDYEPTTLNEYLGLIILYDQISRNMYRNTPKAYDTDNIARKHALFLFDYLEYFPIHVVFTVLICLIHSEDLTIQMQVQEWIKINRAKLNTFASLSPVFIQLTKNHFDRISIFGRIPERNSILNRLSSAKEIAYMSCL
jgi:uncharacterized protein (DUF924 family)